MAEQEHVVNRKVNVIAVRDEATGGAKAICHACLDANPRAEVVERAVTVMVKPDSLHCMECDNIIAIL